MADEDGGRAGALETGVAPEGEHRRALLQSEEAAAPESMARRDGAAFARLTASCAAGLTLALWAAAGPSGAVQGAPGDVIQAELRRCTVVYGKDVIGDYADGDHLFENQTAEECRDICQLSGNCRCYAWDASRLSTCWLKQGACDNFYEWDETGDMVSGACDTGTSDEPQPLEESFGSVETLTQGGTQGCDGCAPEQRPVPELVIPFYERDLCKMRMTAGSITEHDPKGVIGKVHLIWLSTRPREDYAEVIDSIVSAVSASHETHLHDMTSAFRESGMAGWHVQQVMKLKAASLVTSPYYIVLDAKNTFIRDVEPNTFISSCNRGAEFATMDFSSLPEEKQHWYQKSAGVLGVTLPEWRKWGGSVTPVVLHTQTVKGLLAKMGEKASPHPLCSGPLCDHIRGGATEFALYYSYVSSLDNQNCIHENFGKSPAVSLWRGITADGNVGICDWVESGGAGMFMFGAQSDSDAEMSDDQRNRLAGCMAKVFAASLDDPQSSSGMSLLHCAIG